MHAFPFKLVVVESAVVANSPPNPYPTPTEESEEGGRG